MKRGATREEIIRTTQEFIARNGIRAVRVDEIAQTLGISEGTVHSLKKTAYRKLRASLREHFALLLLVTLK